MSTLATLGASVPAQTHQTTTIEISAVTGNQLSVKYTGLPNNMANTYGNFLVCWKNQNTIPWNEPVPVGIVPCKVNSSQGNQVFEGVKVEIDTTYVVGYSVGAKAATEQIWRNVCTTGFVNSADRGNVTYINPDITVTGFLSNSVSVRFTLPTGVTPKTNGAWIAIWETGQASYTQAPIGSNSIGLDSSSGGAAINDISIVIDQTYTVALFMSGWKAGAGGVNVQTAMACTTTFSV